MRTLDELTVTRVDDHLIVHAKARSFLHHQARNMVGSLKMVGEGVWPEHRLEEVLAAANRASAGPTAPAEGLYLVGVGYAERLDFS
jgi:tRNA pseudouridine38-40 synthase